MKQVSSGSASCISIELLYYVGVVPQSELAEIVKLIQLECYGQICTTLGHMRPSPTHYEETVVGVLTDWQKQSPNNRREKLARILLRMGCYKAAIKLDAKGSKISI